MDNFINGGYLNSNNPPHSLSPLSRASTPFLLKPPSITQSLFKGHARIGIQKLFILSPSSHASNNNNPISTPSSLLFILSPSSHASNNNNPISMLKHVLSFVFGQAHSFSTLYRTETSPHHHQQNHHHYLHSIYCANQHARGLIPSPTL
jgi:hypothetical protein